MKTSFTTRVCAAIAALGLTAFAAFASPPDTLKSDPVAVPVPELAVPVDAVAADQGVTALAAKEVAEVADLNPERVAGITFAYNIVLTQAAAGAGESVGLAFTATDNARPLAIPLDAIVAFQGITDAGYALNTITAPDLDTSPNLAIAGLGIQFNGVIVDSSPHVAGTALIEPDTSPTVATTITVAELDTSAAIGLQLKENGFEVTPASGA